MTVSRYISSRSIMLFEESIKSKYTKKIIPSISRNLKDTQEFTVQNYQRYPQNSYNTFLRTLIHLKYNTNPNSISSKFQGIHHFCIMNQINLNWEIIHKNHKRLSQISWDEMSHSLQKEFQIKPLEKSPKGLQ